MSSLDKLRIREEDVYRAMKDLGSFVDITAEDFKTVYEGAIRHVIDRLGKSILARDVMTRNMVTARSETPLADVASLMAGNQVSGIPIVDEDNRVKGVISEKDFMRHVGIEQGSGVMGVIAQLLNGKGCLAPPQRSAIAGEIMNSPAITVSENTPLAEIARIFQERGINRVPVVDRERRLRGIVSRGDIVNALPAYLAFEDVTHESGIHR